MAISPTLRRLELDPFVALTNVSELVNVILVEAARPIKLSLTTTDVKSTFPVFEMVMV